MKDGAVRVLWLNGWQLLWAISAWLIILAAATLVHDPGVRGARSTAVTTVLGSFVLFLFGFTASALYRIWPTPLSVVLDIYSFGRWQHTFK